MKQQAQGKQARRRRRASFSQPMVILVLLVLTPIAGGSFLLGCQGDDGTETAPLAVMSLKPGTPVIFITIDTLREDHMGCSGYGRDTTPFLDRFADDGVYFSKCFSQCSWTLPSMLSLFSSLSPPVFGIRDGVEPVPRVEGQALTGQPEMNIEVFPDAHVTLPEVLRENGYTTVGISTNGHLIERQGFTQGFDIFNETDCMWGTAACALDLALEELEQVDTNHLFLWVHIFDPHFDQYGKPPIYTPPPGYESMFGQLSQAGAAERTLLDYDRKIRYTDDRLRDFFTALEDRGILDQFLVVIAADHGEEFSEKGRWGHSKALTNTLIHVPLIFRLPGKQGAGRVVSDVVRNIDVMPTILDLLNLPSPPTAEGVCLRPAMGGDELQPLLVYSETQRNGRNMRCLIDPEADRKFVLDIGGETRELYALSSDNNEQRNLATAEAPKIVEMNKRLLSMIREMKRRAITETTQEGISEEERKRLESLGYIGG
ncbi:sulfatase [Candidatus Eisenbacteria bacterium]|uniref:Sulfatase n=1 Tax=Eiseniibacteriota bacterium TaxID=2212470 RepID=A0ABV6YLE3_UNCEI